MNKKETSAQAENIVRPYTLRKMKDSDLYPVLDIITKVFPDDLAAMFMQLASGEKNVTEVGAVAVVNLCVSILKNIDKVEDEVYSFLADISGIPVAEIREMPFGTTPMMIMDIANDAKNADFFRVVSKLF